MNRKELGREMLDNMDLTKEQYHELCALCDELELEKLDSQYVEPKNQEK